MSRTRSALAALSADEEATVLDELLAARPDLHALAETHAARLMSQEDRFAVAQDVEDELRGRDVEELNGRAGHRPGWGYVDPGEAADEILDEALAPFLHDLERRAALGMGTATVELAVGVLLGLYRCRDAGSETLLEYAPDYAAERAENLLVTCAKGGVELPTAELMELVPGWSRMLR